MSVRDPNNDWFSPWEPYDWNVNDYFKPYVEPIDPNKGKIPHRCPVCSGKGIVPNGFYSTSKDWSTTSLTPETCRACMGKGIIFS